MAKRGRMGSTESRGPKYYCFLCQGSIDSPIQACPKHEPELHRKLSDIRKKREKKFRPEPEAAKERPPAPQKSEEKPRREKEKKKEEPESEE